MLYGLLFAVVVATGFIIWRYALSSSRYLPLLGDAAPDFDLRDQNGKSRTLTDFRGRWLVLYFYPRDDTPGCTEQAARYRDVMQSFEKLGAAVCGVSVDDGDSHAAFARKYNLPFPLLADRGGLVARRYGSLIDLALVRFARRNTFVIDPRGVVARVYVGVNPARNAGDVFSDLSNAMAT